jgi:molybdopterin-guanine dinucleotide biosynthesis protein B
LAWTIASAESPATRRLLVVPTVSIIGHSRSGKTTLVARLLPILAARGFHVGTVKHAPHLDRVDAPASDSAVHFGAGSHRALLRGEHSSALFWRHGPAALADEIDRLFSDCDLVLVEGDKGGPFPKIEVFRRAGELARQPLAGEIDVDAVVTDERVPLPDDLPVFRTHELERIADEVEALAFSAAR